MSTVTIITVTAMIITVSMKDTTTPLKMASVLSVLEMVGGSADGGNGRVALSPGSTAGGAEELSEMNYLLADCKQGRDFYSVVRDMHECMAAFTPNLKCFPVN